MRKYEIHIKATIWFFISMTVTFVVVAAYHGVAVESVSIAAIAAAIRAVVFFYYEKAWRRLNVKSNS